MLFDTIQVKIKCFLKWASAGPTTMQLTLTVS